MLIIESNKAADFDDPEAIRSVFSPQKQRNFNAFWPFLSLEESYINEKHSFLMNTFIVEHTVLK